LLGTQPLGNRDYLLLVAGNIGAVIMPWMIFYQQSATVDKGLTPANLPFARIDTAIGSVLTQIIMIAIIVTAAATLFVHGQKVDDAAHAALALGALVVSLASAWAFGEAFAWPCSLNYNCTEAKRFYGLYAGMVALAAAIVLIPRLPLVKITVYVEAFNALVLPLVLGFLLVLSNDKKVLGSRVNSLLGNVIAFGISDVCIVLGVWYGFLTITGQAG
jgi:Mn2+/Fe2+ NRAMP family transporter